MAHEADLAAYHLGVGDEVQVSVMGQPEFSRSIKVRPDGAISTPGAGTIFALGRSPEDVGNEIEQRLNRYLRYPRVDLVVNSYGDHKVFVMGEVVAPGDIPYHKGITALQAIAEAGGIRASGKSSVLLLRRTAADSAFYQTLDLSGELKGKGGPDIMLEPYDIVYVPRTFITDVGIFMDQYFRSLTAPFTFYLEGWDAFHASSRWVRR